MVLQSGAMTTISAAVSSSSSFSSPAIDRDWYGNSLIHHIAGSRYPERPDIPALLSLLERNPYAASATNQFRRLPLHYALDRCKPDYELIQILCEFYPAGVVQRDNEDATPVDLAVKWKHPAEVMRLLMKNNPAVSRLYPTLYLVLTYGTVLGTMMAYLVGTQLVPGNRIEHNEHIRHSDFPSVDPTGNDDHGNGDEDVSTDRSVTDNSVGTTSGEEDNRVL